MKGLEINKIHEGDCLELMKDIPTGSVDMILCDLPYGTTVCKWDAIIPLEPLWTEYERIIKPNGAIVLTATQPFTSALVLSRPKLFKYTWVWEKTMAIGSMFAKKRPMKAHEDICVFYKKQPIYNPQMLEGKAYKKKEGSLNNDSIIGERGGGYETINKGVRYPRSVITVSNPNRHNVHPTQKPIALFEYLIKTYTNEGDTVLDNCIGSGTTAIAAIRTGRNFIGIEQESEYVEISRRRIEKQKITNEE